MAKGRDDNMSTQFPCPRDGELITLADCWHCDRRNFCDIRALLLDESSESD